MGDKKTTGTLDVTQIDKAIAQAKNRKATRGQGQGIPAEKSQPPKAAKEGPGTKRPRLTDEEKAAREQTKATERADKKATRDTARAAKKAEKDANKSPAHMKKVLKAAERLGTLDQAAQLLYNEAIGSLTAAELAKLALNSYITMKISFANMIGDALRTCGQDAGPALEFVGSDPRIGSKCFKYGWGYGGPCFPRDNRALSTFLREVGSYDYLPIAAHESNERHAVEQAKHFQGDTMTGLCYKDNCDVPIVEESHKVKTALVLKSMGRKLKLEDTPEVLALLPPEVKEYTI